MENKSSAAIGNSIIMNTDNNVRDPALPKTKKKKRGAMHVIRVAMHMLRSKSSKSKATNVEAASTWKKFVASMRPFHVQSNQSPPRPIEALAAAPAPVRTVVEVENFEAFTPPLSPAQASVASSSSGSASKYASATNLQELDPCNGSDEEDYEDEEDRYFDDKAADEMIDEKAEVFIAKFYESMRIQRENYTNIRKNQKTK